MNNYNSEQMREIVIGIRKGIDITPYVSSDFNAQQMKQLRLGIQKGIDISQYKYPYMNADIMKELRIALEQGINCNVLEVRDGDNFTAEQAKQIRLGLQNKQDIALYANPELSADKMKEIRIGQKDGVNASLYANNSFTVEQMHKLRIEMTITRILEQIKQSLLSLFNSIIQFAKTFVSNDNTEMTNDDVLAIDEFRSKLANVFDELYTKVPDFDEMDIDNKMLTFAKTVKTVITEETAQKDVDVAQTLNIDESTNENEEELEIQNHFDSYDDIFSQSYRIGDSMDKKELFVSIETNGFQFYYQAFDVSVSDVLQKYSDANGYLPNLTDGFTQISEAVFAEKQQAGMNTIDINADNKTVTISDGNIFKHYELDKSNKAISAQKKNEKPVYLKVTQKQLNAIENSGISFRKGKADNHNETIIQFEKSQSEQIQKVLKSDKGIKR